MVQLKSKLITFDEFLDWCPDNDRYELINGTIIAMQPPGKHEEITDFIATQLTLEVHRLKPPYGFPRYALIKAFDKDTGYRPDVLVVDRHALSTEPLWEKSSTLTQGKSVRLVIEVVSTNWRDDYNYKLSDYEALGICEYWIVDYLGLGGRRYIGFPKQPTVTICQLVDGEYQLQHFRGKETIISSAFPELNLTVEKIFRAEA